MIIVHLNDYKIRSILSLSGTVLLHMNLSLLLHNLVSSLSSNIYRFWTSFLWWVFQQLHRDGLKTFTICRCEALRLLMLNSNDLFDRNEWFVHEIIRKEWSNPIHTQLISLRFTTKSNISSKKSFDWFIKNLEKL